MFQTKLKILISLFVVAFLLIGCTAPEIDDVPEIPAVDETQPVSNNNEAVAAPDVTATSEGKAPPEKIERAGCSSALSQFLDEAAYGVDVDLPELDEPIEITTYHVQNGQLISSEDDEELPEEFLSYQEDTYVHEFVWAVIFDVLPVEISEKMDKFVVFTDGSEKGIGAVGPGFNESAWSFEIDIVDAENTGLLATTIVHEMAHLVTLDDSQFDSGEVCSSYESADGCFAEGSYIEQFYYLFWDEINTEWSEAVLTEEFEVNDDAVTSYYEDHWDLFVSEYAATDIDEDIAESFMFFVLNEKPDPDKPFDEKVLFFYDFPELTSLRSDIRSTLCEYLGE